MQQMSLSCFELRSSAPMHTARSPRPRTKLSTSHELLPTQESCCGTWQLCVIHPTSCRAPRTKTLAETERTNTFQLFEVTHICGFSPEKHTPSSTHICLISTESAFDLDWKPSTKKLLKSEFVPGIFIYS